LWFILAATAVENNKAFGYIVRTSSFTSTWMHGAVGLIPRAMNSSEEKAASIYYSDEWTRTFTIQ
jgi:hypothetical protein